MKKMAWKGPLFLLLAAFFWGTTFVAQDLASDAVKPFTFNGFRMILGALFLLPVIYFKNKGKFFATIPKKEDKMLLLSTSLMCAGLMFVAANLQQFGIFMGTGAGKSGFITAMYVVMVPIFGLFLGKRVRGGIWVCVFSAAVGLYLLCMASFSDGMKGVLENLTMSTGDLLTLGCAVFYTFHIVYVDAKAPETDGVWLSCLQFLFAGIVGIVFAFIFEKPSFSDIMAASGGILYSAFFSCAVAYTLQILGQQITPAAIAAIICRVSSRAMIKTWLMMYI